MGDVLGLLGKCRAVSWVRSGGCHRCGRVRSPDDVALGMANVGIDRCKRHVSDANSLRGYAALSLDFGEKLSQELPD